MAAQVVHVWLYRPIPDRSCKAQLSTYPRFERIEIDESHFLLQCHPVAENYSHGSIETKAWTIRRSAMYLVAIPSIF